MTTIYPKNDRDVVDAPQVEQQGEQRWNTVNVSHFERWASGIGGGALTTYGLMRRDWVGLGLAFLGAVLAYRGISGHSFLYQATDINTANQDREASTGVQHGKGIKIEKVVTINRSPEELYSFWHTFENLPRFMQHLDAVEVKDATHSHWKAKAPAGTSVEWDAVIINDQENELIAWRSLEGSQIGNAGSVHFTPAPGGRGTEIKVVLEYDPPAGRLGALAAKLFGQEPEQQVREDLRHFKEMMEAGEIPTTQGQAPG